MLALCWVIKLTALENAAASANTTTRVTSRSLFRSRPSAASLCGYQRPRIRLSGPPRKPTVGELIRLLARRLLAVQGCRSGTRGVLLGKGGDQDGLDGVEAVLGLVEDDAGARLEDLTGDLETAGHAGVLHHLAAHRGVGVVERGQAVHELDLRVAGLVQQGGVELIGREDLDAFGSDLLGVDQ